MVCNLRVLGCSGGISKDLRTTSFLLNDNILIDAGTGVGDLTLDELRKIDFLFLTHSHLDHICSLPFILDAVGVNRPRPLKVLGITETIQALKNHIFNNVIWPDFTQIPNPENPCVVFEIIQINQTIQVGDISITALPVNHSISANAYWIDSSEGALVFSGDTGPSDAFWEAIQQNINTKSREGKRDYLRHLIIETSFTNAEQELAGLSGHYHPNLLVKDLQKLNSVCNVWVTHLKPDEAPLIMKEIVSSLNKEQRQIQAQSLKGEQILRF